MFARFWANSAAKIRRCSPPFEKQLAAAACVFILSLTTTACVRTPSQPFIGPDPSKAGISVSAVSDRSTLGSYVSQRPVEPKSWREQNDRIAPPTKP